MRQGEVVQSVRGTFVGPWQWRCDCGKEGHGETADHARALIRAHWKQSDHRDGPCHYDHREDGRTTDTTERDVNER